MFIRVDSLKPEINRHILFYCALFHLADTDFYKLMVCGNSVSNKSLGAISPETFAHFVSLSYFGNSCDI